MASVDDILTDNIKDALSQAQWFLTAGIVSAVLFVLSSIWTLAASINKAEVFSVPIVGEFPRSWAVIVLLCSYVVCGCLANLAISRILRLLPLVDVSIARALLTRFSLFTAHSRLIRLGGILLAPSIIFFSWSILALMDGVPQHIVFLIGPLSYVLGLPYIRLARRLRQAITL